MSAHILERLTDESIGLLKQMISTPSVSRDEGAVAESLGYYYDADGRALLASSSVGIDLEGLRPSCRMVAVSAGARKAQAIAAVMRSRPYALLVTDEGAAQEMLRMASNP